MPLITLSELCLAYGHQPLLDHADLQIDTGERICLVGRNGAGKSTLLRIIGGQINADEGKVWRQPGLRIARLDQELPPDDPRTVFEAVTAGLGTLSELIGDYHRTAVRLASSHAEADLKHLEQLQHALEAQNGWRLEQRVEEVISRLQLPADKPVSELSGGWRRRVALGQALVTDPDLLLLDEPTNHLDIEAIDWLERQLLDFRGAVLFITHDRRFLERLATRIIELDRGRLSSWPGDFATYQRRKQAQLDAEAAQNAEFDKKLAQEEAWIRQGIKARRTRNEGRVRALLALRETRRERRSQPGKASLKLDEAEQSGQLVIEASGVSFDYQGTPLIRDFSTRIQRGDHIGIIGPNGSGKSTLLHLLLGELAPQRGSVRHGTRLQIAYFDQLRAQLDEARSVLDNVSEGREYITVDGRRKHIVGYLQDFLFTPERAHTPVKALSGGERNRLLLARLFSNPANLLVLDEPTNDLDMETLELLEELLLDYQGTLLLVSHDRAFLDNVVTGILAFEGDGHIGEYVGGYSDWLRQRPAIEPAQPKAKAAKPAATPTKPERRKLSYKEQRELDALPGRIEALEDEQAQLQALIAQPDFYRRPQDQIAATLARLKTLEGETQAAYARWEALDALGR